MNIFRARSIGFSLLLVLSGAASAQVNNPAYANYFLVGQFGEVCTMCEVVVYCSDDIYDTPRATLPEDGSYTVYHLQTRTFWSQVSTIWEWFITNFEQDSLARSGHTRPVKIYTVVAGEWSGPEVIEAHLALEPALITLGDRRIDRVERRWLSGEDNQLEGFCQRMPLWESIELIDAKAPEGANQ
jgi:hypothetical protein